jgi:Flp pilus assembly pilin Flp
LGSSPALKLSTPEQSRATALHSLGTFFCLHENQNSGNRLLGSLQGLLLFHYSIYRKESSDMKNSHKTIGLKRQNGQGMTEYIIIVALIAVAAIAAFQFFGQTIRSQTSGIANEVAGQSASSAIDAAKASANNTNAQRDKKGLDAYNSDAPATK